MNTTETPSPMQAAPSHPDIPVVVLPQVPLQLWADCVTGMYQKSVEDIRNIGRVLNQAKTIMRHGEWEKMFKGHPQAVARPVPFSLATGRMYMAIAAHPVLNHYHGNDLPASWRTLYELSHLSAPVLEELLASGAVHPELTRGEAVALGNQHSGSPRLADSPKDQSQIAWSIGAVEQRLLAAINREIECAPPDSRPLISDLVLRIGEQLKEAANQELREAVAIARDELSVHDFEPGAYRIFEDEAQASTHPGSPNVVASCKSTYPDCYKDVTTAKEGVTPLTRRQVEARLTDIDKGKLATAKTERTHSAVLWAIKPLSRTSSLGRERSG